jgi:hypothetical protein
MSSIERSELDRGPADRNARPGVPRPDIADGRTGVFRPAPSKAPPSPWTAHLRSLIGQPVTIVTYGPASLVEYHGKLIAIALDHMNCAIESDTGAVMTFKNVHHITSLKRCPL